MHLGRRHPRQCAPGPGAVTRTGGWSPPTTSGPSGSTRRPRPVRCLTDRSVPRARQETAALLARQPTPSRVVRPAVAGPSSGTVIGGSPGISTTVESTCGGGPGPNGRDDHRDIVDHRRTTRAVQIAQRRYPARPIPVAPLNHRQTRNPHPASDFRVRHPLGSQQHDPRPLRQPRLHRRGTHQRTQPRLITGPKNKRSSNRHTSLPQSHTVKSLPTRGTSSLVAPS